MLRVLHRLAVALRLLPRCFDLVFRALHAFCPAQSARTFAVLAAALAAQGRTTELRSLLQNIQGVITCDEWDQVFELEHSLFCPFCHVLQWHSSWHAFVA